jgi:hypothetical protein
MSNFALRRAKTGGVSVPAANARGKGEEKSFAIYPV